MASPSKKSFALRIDPELWAEIERLAAMDLRSANAQVEFLLRDALARRGLRLKPPQGRGAARVQEPTGRAGAGDAADAE